MGFAGLRGLVEEDTTCLKLENPNLPSQISALQPSERIDNHTRLNPKTP